MPLLQGQPSSPRAKCTTAETTRETTRPPVPVRRAQTSLPGGSSCVLRPATDPWPGSPHPTTVPLQATVPTSGHSSPRPQDPKETVPPGHGPRQTTGPPRPRSPQTTGPPDHGTPRPQDPQTTVPPGVTPLLPRPPSGDGSGQPLRRQARSCAGLGAPHTQPSPGGLASPAVRDPSPSPCGRRP